MTVFVFNTLMISALQALQTTSTEENIVKLEKTDESISGQKARI